MKKTFYLIAILFSQMALAEIPLETIQYQCSSSKSFKSRWKRTNNVQTTMKAQSLRICDLSEDLTEDEKIKQCKEILSKSMASSSMKTKFLSSMKAADQKAFLKASKNKMMELLFSSKKITEKQTRDTKTSGTLGHPELKMTNLIYDFGLLTDEELRPMIMAIKNDEEGAWMSLERPNGTISMDTKFIKLLTENYDQNKLKYRVRFNGKTYYAISTYSLKQAKEAVKIAKAIRPDVDISKLSLLDFHFWLSPGWWDASESDARIAKMEALSKLQGDPMITVVIDHSDEMNPTLYLLSTDDVGETKIAQTSQLVDGKFQASLEDAYVYKELHTKFSSKLEIQCSPK